MKTPTNLRILLLISLVHITSVFVLSQAINHCPGPDRLTHQDGGYKFSYESWVKVQPSGKSFLFGRCVENLDGGALPINWLSTNRIILKGFALPNVPLYTELPSDSGASVLLPSAISYGLDLRGPLETKVRDMQEAEEQSKTPSALQTFIQMSFPDNDGVKALRNIFTHRLKISNKNFHLIQFRFTSKVELRPNGSYSYIFTAENLSSAEAGEVNFHWKSRQLSNLFMKDIPVWQSQPGIAINAHAEVNGSNPQYYVTGIEFLGPDKRPIAEIPVAIYAPKNLLIAILNRGGE